MKAPAWCFLWIILEIVLTSGYNIHDDDEYQSRAVCCEVGTQLATIRHNCNSAADELPQFKNTSPESCEGYMRQCCRRKLREKECETGRVAALTKKDCKDLPSGTSEDCCAACKTGIMSKTCSAPWLDDDIVVSKVFFSCCPPFLLGGSQNQQFTAMAPKEQQFTQAPKCLRKGYVYDPVSSTCRDIDECSLKEDLCPKGTNCVNTEGGYECTRTRPGRETTPSCAVGFSYSHHLKDCIDVDECAAGTHTCNPNQVCMNLEGSFKCKRASNSRCSAGYVYKTGVGCVDIDECASANLCSADEVCVNRVGYYMCAPPCEPGFFVDPVSLECVDIDECATNTHSCKNSQDCVNTEGSFVCKESNTVDSCSEGFQRSANGECKDIDECARRTHDCSASQKCINHDGGFSCVEQCEKGFVLNSAGRCEDVDECATSSPCLDSREVCQNTRGGYVCECKSGFEKIGSICSDRNECAEGYPSACPGNSFCENTVGSFNCIPEIVHCQEGMRRSPDATRCENIDECSEDLHDCDLSSEVCLDRTGSFDCVCKDGFVRDGSGKCVSLDSRRCDVGYQRFGPAGECRDINECNVPGVCEHECKNTPGSYECKCKPGFQPDKRNTAKCVDINECKTAGVCPGLCENTQGSFKCSCPEGYEMKGNACVDINECETQKPCLSSETCLNIGGGFRCLSYECPTNYIKDKSNAMRCMRDKPCGDQTHCSLDPDLIIFNHIPLSSGFSRRPLSVRISGQRNVLAEFSLHISKVVSLKRGLKEATDENFLLKTWNTSAKVYVRKSIPGPQDVHLTLKAKLYHVRNETHTETDLFKIVEWRLVLYVPAYDL